MFSLTVNPEYVAELWSLTKANSLYEEYQALSMVDQNLSKKMNQQQFLLQRKFRSFFPDDMYPKVSFICPTAGRFPDEAHLLEQKIMWFTQQIYPIHRMELIILNDSPKQSIRLKYNENIYRNYNIKVFNSKSRYSTLGDKLNALLALASGDVIINDEDDDISLPNRALQSVMKLYGLPLNKPARDFFDVFDPGVRWYQDRYHYNTGNLIPTESGIQPDSNNCRQHAFAWRRNKIAYRSTTGNQDQLFLQDLKQSLTLRMAEHINIKDCEIPSYVYRWGVSKLHLSSTAHGCMQQAMNDWHDKIMPGDFDLECVPSSEMFEQAKLMWETVKQITHIKSIMS